MPVSARSSDRVRTPKLGRSKSSSSESRAKSSGDLTDLYMQAFTSRVDAAGYLDQITVLMSSATERNHDDKEPDGDPDINDEERGVSHGASLRRSLGTGQ
jgi:hypothetical protein